MTVLRVGTRELKSKLSAYLRRVKDGETIIVTERGKVIGQIIPVRATVEEKMQAVVDAGLAEWNGMKLKPEKPPALNTGKQQVSDLVAENRDVDYLF
jgi:prevent-host-death family protein